MVLVLDVVASAPVVCLPQSSSGASFIEVDMGTLEVSNVIQWRK